MKNIPVLPLARRYRLRMLGMFLVVSWAVLTVVNRMAVETDERLVFLTERPDRFPLEMIPTALIPTEEYASELNQEQRSRLVELIDRRKVQWGKLRTSLEGATHD